MSNKKPVNKKLTPNLKLKMRNEFVQGYDGAEERVFPNLDEIIKKNKIAKSTLYRLASSENWKQQRAEFQQEFTQKLDEKRTKDRIKEATNFDSSSINLAKGIYSSVAQSLQINNKQINEGKQPLPPQAIRSLASAAHTAQRIAKLALGESTENINASVKDTTSFREAMDLLDEVANAKRRGDLESIH